MFIHLFLNQLVTGCFSCLEMIIKFVDDPVQGNVSFIIGKKSLDFVLLNQ